MKRKSLYILLAISTLLTGCCLSHNFTEATCTQPQTCIKCGETEGETLPHTWVEATCEKAKTCSACEKTEGEPLGHSFSESTCIESAKCLVCGEIGEEAKGHDWQDATTSAPKTCKTCGLTEGEPLPVPEESVEIIEEDNQASNSSEQELSIEEQAQKLIEDYIKEHSQYTQIEVEYPGMIPYDPSQDGQYYLGQGGELPPELQGSVTQ